MASELNRSIEIVISNFALKELVYKGKSQTQEVHIACNPFPLFFDTNKTTRYYYKDALNSKEFLSKIHIKSL